MKGQKVLGIALAAILALEMFAPVYAKEKDPSEVQEPLFGAGENGKTDEDNAKLKGGNAAKNLKKMASKQEPVCVQFDFNREDTGVDLPLDKELFAGDSLELPILSKEVTDKYSFLGWDTNDDGTPDTDPGQSITVEESKTITGIWDINCGRISFAFHTKEFTGDHWYDRNHEPIEDLTGYDVLLKDASGKVIERAETSSTGEIFFDKLPKGNYTFELKVPDNMKVKKLVDGNESASQDQAVSFKGQTITLPFFNKNLSMRKSLFIEVEKEPTFTVTIDPDGGTINEEYKTTEVVQGKTFELPYTFKSEIAKPGYTLTGYEVTGTLFDKDGKQVQEINRYKAEYQPQSDVTLKAKWEKTNGEVVIYLYDGHPAEQKDKYALKLVDKEGKEYFFTSNAYTPSGSRTWKVKDVPNGDYTLKIEGIEGKYDAEAKAIGGSEFLKREISVKDAGNYTVNVAFKDNTSAQFVRYEIRLTEMFTVTFDSQYQGEFSGVKTKEVKAGEVAGKSGLIEDMMGDDRHTFDYWTVNGKKVNPEEYVITKDTTFVAHYKAKALTGVFGLTIQAQTDEDYAKLKNLDAAKSLKLEYIKGVGDYTNDGLKLVMKRASSVDNLKAVTYEVTPREFGMYVSSNEIPEGSYKLTISGLDATFEYGPDELEFDGFSKNNRGGVFEFHPSKDTLTLNFDMKLDPSIAKDPQAYILAKMTSKSNDRPKPDDKKKDATITYDPGDGHFKGMAKGQKKVETHKQGDMIKIIEAPIREGYTFLYWEGSQHKPGDKYTVEGDHTFTAKWEKDDEGGSSNHNGKNPNHNSKDPNHNNEKPNHNNGGLNNNNGNSNNNGNKGRNENNSSTITRKSGSTAQGNPSTGIGGITGLITTVLVAGAAIVANKKRNK